MAAGSKQGSTSQPSPCIKLMSWLAGKPGGPAIASLWKAQNQPVKSTLRYRHAAISLKLVQCLLGENAYVFASWWVTAVFIPYVTNTGLSCPKSLRCSSVLPEFHQNCPVPLLPAPIKPQPLGPSALHHCLPPCGLGDAHLHSAPTTTTTTPRTIAFEITHFSLRLMKGLPSITVSVKISSSSRVWNASFVACKKPYMQKIPEVGVRAQHFSAISTIKVPKESHVCIAFGVIKCCFCLEVTHRSLHMA